MNRSQRYTSRRAFTLIETVVSLVVVSVLMLGLSASMMLGSYALPSTAEMGESDRQVHQVIALLRDEFRRSTDIKFRTASGGVQLKMSLKTTGETGEMSSVTWEYDASDDELCYKCGTGSMAVVLENISSVSATLIQDGSELRVFHLVMVVEGTIQRTFECHFLLPDAPEVK